MTSTAGRLVRTAVVVVLLLLVGPGPASAAGTGGIEISPYPGVVEGKQLTAFRTKVPADTVEYSLRNTTAAPKSARLYAASAAADGKGGWAIGDAGSSPYLVFADQRVTLKAQETRLSSFGVRGEIERETVGAIVVEVTSGSVTTRAATLVYLSPSPLVPLPLLIVLIAVGVLLLAGVAFVLVRRKGRPTSAPT